MKVKYTGESGIYLDNPPVHVMPGQIVDVPDAKGQSLITGGNFESAEPAKPKPKKEKEE